MGPSNYLICFSVSSSKRFCVFWDEIKIIFFVQLFYILILCQSICQIIYYNLLSHHYANLLLKFPQVSLGFHTQLIPCFSMLVLSTAEVCFGTLSCNSQSLSHTHLKSLSRSSSTLRLLHQSTLFSTPAPQMEGLKSLTNPSAHSQFLPDSSQTQLLKHWSSQLTVCFSSSYSIFYLHTNDNLPHSVQGSKSWGESSCCRFMTFLCWVWKCFQRIWICFEIYIMIFVSLCGCFCHHYVLIERLVIFQAHWILWANPSFFKDLKIVNSDWKISWSFSRFIF